MTKDVGCVGFTATGCEFCLVMHRYFPSCQQVFIDGLYSVGFSQFSLSLLVSDNVFPFASWYGFTLFMPFTLRYKGIIISRV